MVNRQKPKSLASSVVERLLGEIRTGRYPAGKQLPTESTLMGEFGVSRTVVRSGPFGPGMSTATHSLSMIARFSSVAVRQKTT